MGGLPLESWALILTIIGAAVFGTLYVLASILRDAARRVDLYKRVAELRAEYAQQAAELAQRRTKVPQFVEVVAEAAPVRQAA
jgi:hypothetical protein